MVFDLKIGEFVCVLFVLFYFVGCYLLLFDFVDDGWFMILFGMLKVIDLLVWMWCYDDIVEMLLVGIVLVSCVVGKFVWLDYLVLCICVFDLLVVL